MNNWIRAYDASNGDVVWFSRNLVAAFEKHPLGGITFQQSAYFWWVRKQEGLPLCRGVAINRGLTPTDADPVKVAEDTGDVMSEPDDPTKRKTEKIVREIARGEEYEPVGTMPVVGDRVVCCDSQYIGQPGFHDQPQRVSRIDEFGDACVADASAVFRRALFVTGENRILKREPGTELLGARVYESDGDHLVRIGEAVYYKANYGVWINARLRPSDTADWIMGCYKSATELHGAERESILADPALLALVGG